MDLATLIKPVLTAGELRIVGSTTFEEFKAKPDFARWLARGILPRAEARRATGA